MNEDKMLDRLVLTYRDLYFQELDRKEKLNGRLPILVGVYTILLGVIGAFLNDVPSSTALLPLLLFYTFLGLEVCALGISILYAALFLSTDDLDASYLMPPREQNLEPLTDVRRREEQWRLRIGRWISREEDVADEEDEAALMATLQGMDAYMTSWQLYNTTARFHEKADLERELLLLLREQYGKAAHSHFRLNGDKQVYFGVALRFVVCGLVCAACCGASYFYLKLTADKSIHRVEIVTARENIPMDTSRKSTKTDAQGANNPASRRLYPKPVRPEVFIKRDTDTMSQAVRRIQERAASKRAK